MTIKTFRGKSVQQAIAMVKSEIGRNAVILSTKKVPKDLNNPYGEHLFEVTASLPETGGIKAPVFEKKAVSSVKMKKKEAKPSFIKDIESMDIQEDSSPDKIYGEIMAIKDLLVTIQSNQGVPEYLFKFPGASSIYGKLMDCGVSSHFAKDIIIKAYSKEKGIGSSAEGLRQRTFVEMMSIIETVEPFEHLTKPKAAAFIGPTGVGKTTTIAKIAANLTIKKGLNVGLVSVDNYRVGALEQLKTYAAILGIPCYPAFSRTELEKALSRMRSKDVILIDTAGISSFDEEKLNELKEIFSPVMEVETHLVLSLTSSIDNLKDSAGKFSELNPSSYVFTKFDEVSKKGHILDQLAFMRLPVSFITDGQRVPEDISEAVRKTILKKIFKD